MFDLNLPQDSVTFDLVSATQDPATGTIVAIFTEASAGSGTATVPGPADFEAAFSWDETLVVGSPTTISLKKTIAVPEPAAALLRVSVLVALAALALHRRTGSYLGR